MTTGIVKTFPGFTVGNPQHLAWMKRKLARQARYERQKARRPSGGGVKQARHLQSRKPAPQLLRPMGRDAATMEFQWTAREVLCWGFGADARLLHVNYRRHPLTGRIL